MAVSRAEQDCGISLSGLSKQLPNKDNPDGKSIGSDNLEKILNHFSDLSADWLLRGEGSMIKGGSKAAELENRIAKMSKDKEYQERAYDILLGLFDTMEKTFEFFGNKEC